LDIDDSYCSAVATALVTAISRLEYSNADVPLVEIRKVLKDISNEDKSTWEISEFDSLCLESCNENQLSDIKKQLDHRFFSFVTFDDKQARLTDKDSVPHEAFISGQGIVSDLQQGKDSQRSLANNYCLAYPERMRMLAYFVLPGETKSVLNGLDHHFLFHKKVNNVLTSCFFENAKVLGMLEQDHTHGMKLHRLPDTAIAFLAVRCYFEASAFQVDVGISVKDVQTILDFYIPRKNLIGPWRSRLAGPGITLFRDENAQSQIRLTTEGFLWFVSCGLVDPVDVARVLRNLGAKKPLKLIAKCFEDRIEKSMVRTTAPLNKAEFLENFT
jgi:hypothetical protein